MPFNSNQQSYLAKSGGGARINFDFNNFRLVDVENDEEVPAYFLLGFSEDVVGRQNAEVYIELTAAEAFELIARFMYLIRSDTCEDHFNEVMQDSIDELLYSTTNPITKDFAQEIEELLNKND